MPEETLKAEALALRKTHVALGAGQQEFEGMYLSTEEAGNRYEEPGKPAVEMTADIQNPKVFRHAVEYGSYREQFLPQGVNINDATDAQVAEAGRKATNALRQQGYDSVYLPESETNEGILVVFDRSKVKGAVQGPAAEQAAAKVWYHGTPAETLNFGKAPKGNELPFGVHFTEDKGLAEDFASGATKGKPTGKAGRIIEAELNIKNPLDVQKGVYVEGTKEYEVLKEIAIRSGLTQAIRPFKDGQFIGVATYTDGRVEKLPEGTINAINPKEVLNNAKLSAIKAVLKEKGYDQAIKYSMFGARDPLGMGAPVYTPAIAILDKNLINPIEAQPPAALPKGELITFREYGTGQEVSKPNNIVYRTSKEPFDKSKIGAEGVHVTNDRSFVESWAETHKRKPESIETLEISSDANILKREDIPKRFITKTEDGLEIITDDTQAELTRYAKENGYDGYEFWDYNKKGQLVNPEYVILNSDVIAPTQTPAALPNYQDKQAVTSWLSQKPIRPEIPSGIGKKKQWNIQMLQHEWDQQFRAIQKLPKKERPTDTRPDYLKRIEEGEGTLDDVQAVAGDYLREKFGWPQRSAKSEAEYYQIDDDRRIRLAQHDVVYPESDVDLVISVGPSQDADVIIPEGASSEQIRKIIDEAMAKFQPTPEGKVAEPGKKPKGRTGGFLDNAPFGNKDNLQAKVEEVMSLSPKPETVPAEEKKKSLKELKRTDTLTTFKNVAEDAVKGVDRAFGIMSTRIKNISQKLFQEIRNKYINPVKMIIADRTQKIHPFVDGIGKLSDADAYDFEVARWTGDIETVERIIEQYGLQEAYNKYRLVFDLIYHEGKAVGMDMNYMTAYFPSKVKDLDGLLKELNRKEEYAPIVKALAEAQDKKGRPLAKEEQVQVLDTLLRGYRTTGVSLTPPGFTRIRTLIRDDIGLIKYYYGFAETSSRYIESMTENIQARKFFGKQTKEVVQLRANISRQKTTIAKWQKDTEKDRTKNIQDAKDKLQQYETELLNLDDGTLNASIGGYVLDLIVDGTINYDQQVELRQIFEGLFNTVGSNRWVHTLRSLEYVGSLAQVPALVTQYSEVILSVLKAPGTTLPNWVRAHLNQSKIKLQDIGVAHIGQEWADADLDNTMTSLMKTFEKVDKVGKETFINSIIDKYRKLAKTNPDKVKEELSKYYPEADHVAIIDSLKSGVVDNNIKGFALNELADVQPISKMEVPELYAKAGNLRVFYMYKTFTLKRLDILRNQAYSDIKTGIKSGSPRQVLKGLAKLLWLALMFSLADSSADIVKDIIRGKPIQSLPDYVVDNLLQMILLSKYAANKVRTEGVSAFFRDNIALPVSTVDAAARDIGTLMDEDSEKGSELARRIPWIGDLYYWHFGEGTRKVEEGYYD